MKVESENIGIFLDVENLTKWIEPLAILIASGFVLWFAFAIFGAIMKVTEVVS